jgi:hypothetical protein
VNDPKRPAVYDRVHERRLGPKCKIWIVDVDFARMPLDIAQVVVIEIADVLLTGALLTRAPHSDLMGLPIKEVMFASTELEKLNQRRRAET